MDKKHAVMAAELVSEKRGIVGITGGGSIDVTKLTKEVGNRVYQLITQINTQRPDLLTDITKAASEISRVDNEIEAIKNSIKGNNTDLPTLQSAESSLRGLEVKECLII